MKMKDRYFQEELYSDTPEERDELRSAYEETYRDGSLKNECWNSGFRSADRMPEAPDDDRE